MRGWVQRAVYGLCVCAAVAVMTPAVASAQAPDVWDPVAGTPPATLGGVPADIQPDSFRAFTLDRGALEGQPRRRAEGGSPAPARSREAISVVLSLPAPGGGFQRFAVQESSIMEPGLAAKHPDIKTYAGRGIDDPAATIRADTTPLGFHASVRSPAGSWYVDPYYHLDDSVYVSYYGRDLDTTRAARSSSASPRADATRSKLGAGAASAAGPEVTLRIYRLALVTDPSYSTYFGGPANVTAAKVTLMNRVDQIYEDETAIRMVLIADTDKLNLNTAAQMTGANGPCGAAACYTAAQVASCDSAR